MRSPSSYAVAFLSVAVLSSACGDSGATLGDTFTVMTHDLGVGADLEAVFAASTAAVPSRVDTLWAQQESASFAARADGIAAGIQRYHPHLVGLQSVLQWWQQTPASAAPADVLVSDYLELLLGALDARGLAYDPVAITTTSDIELTGASGNDYRVVDREVILARRGMPVSAVEGGTYAVQRTIPIAVPAVVNRRGWAMVRATHDSGTVRFLSTRLEPTDPAVQREQARELSGISAGTLPTIVVGNLGSNPQLSSSPAFGILQGTGAPFLDLAGSAGATFPSCCRDVLLSDPGATLDRRIDWVLGRNDVAVWWGSWVNGNGTPMTGGRWVSDHAGVVAGIALFE